MRFVMMCLLSAMLLPGPALADPPASFDPLDRMDAYRLPRRAVVAEVEVVDVALPAGTRGTSHAYRVFLNPALDSVVEMRSAAELGRRVLMTDDAVWLHIPSSARPIRITPLQRLLGQATFGDVGRLTWAGAYRVVAEEEESGLERPAGLDQAAAVVGETFRPLAAHPVRRLRLEAVSPAATYQRLDLWGSAVDWAPLRADYFLSSGKRLKSGWFTEPVTTPDGLMARAVVFHDDGEPERATVMRTGAIANHDRPASFFTVRGFTAAVGGR